VFIRHVLYILTFFTCNFYIIISDFRADEFSTGKESQARKIFYGFFETLYLTQGIYQLMIRLMEVEFRQTMVKDLKQYYYMIRGLAPPDLNASEEVGL
jgi:hypothetical protein